MSRRESSDAEPPFADADAWYTHAMQQPSMISAAESARRAAHAAAHNRLHGIDDAELLADQQLYIQGKLTLEMYQRYLLLKYGAQS